MPDPWPPQQPSRQPPAQPGPRQPPYRPGDTRGEVTAAWEARKELGPEYDEHIAAGLAERVEELVAYRTAELRHQGSAAHDDRELERTDQRHRFVLGIISLGVGVPITAITAETGGLPALLVAWTGIVGVNLAQRLGRHKR